MKIKKNILYLTGMVLLIVFGFIFLNLNFGKAEGPAINWQNQEIQVVKLSVEEGRYVLEPSEIKKNVLTRVEGDLQNMPGCSKSIVIPAFKVSKTFSSGDNFVEFIPDKSGTFNIACSMNMYRGTFSVLESDGSKSDSVEKVSAARNSCGVSNGGCGCGAK